MGSQKGKIDLPLKAQSNQLQLIFISRAFLTYLLRLDAFFHIHHSSSLFVYILCQVKYKCIVFIFTHIVGSR